MTGPPTLRPVWDPTLTPLRGTARKFFHWLRLRLDGQMRDALGQDPSQPLDWFSQEDIDSLTAKFSPLDYIVLAGFRWPPVERVMTFFWQWLREDEPALWEEMGHYPDARAWVATLVRALLPSKEEE